MIQNGLVRNETVTIYLLGDAILDNYYWLNNKDQDLTKEISNMGYKVYNYAADGVKVTDLINGFVPKKVYTSTRSYPYPVINGKMYPLQILANTTGTNKSFTSTYGIMPINSGAQSDAFTVISFGGDDVESRIGNWNMILGTDYFVRTLLTTEFTDNYKKVIDSVLSSCNKIILLSMYVPYMGPNSSYGMYSAHCVPLIKKWHDFLYDIGRKYNLPVLDLDRTLDSQNRSHYGTIDTHPSNASSKCIAKCIDYICRNYDGHHVYYCNNLNINQIVTI